jgi:tetraacyldisaccharide-1-P 4'-kinase
VWRARRQIAPATTTEPVLAAAGIASPASFFVALKENGWNVVAKMPFRDHRSYRSGDVDAIVRRARAAGATRIVTTAKDLVRLLPFRPFAMPIEAVPLTIVVDDRSGLVEWLLAMVGSARAAGAGGATRLGQE